MTAIKSCRSFFLASHLLAAACLLGTGGPARANPPAAVLAARADARGLAPETASYTRYLDLSHLSIEDRSLAIAVLSWHFNSVSREPEIQPPRLIADGATLAVDLRDYAIDPAVWERLASVEAEEPYFHLQVEISGAVEYDQYKRPLPAKKVRKMIAAPWLPPAEIADLILLTHSQAPVVRGDWFYFQTGIQKDRAVGYYDLLGLGTKEIDFQNLVGADAKKARQLKMEIAASVTKSTVALNNRGISRLQALTGGYWFTQDYKKSTDKQNTARLLQGDTEPPAGDASEQYGALPNGLFAYWLQDDKGNRQDAAPDFIATDDKSSSPDRHVYAGLSCARCHTPGLQPIDDFARKLYQTPIQLRSPDYAKLKRLRQLYLTDLPGKLAVDNAVYASAVHACNGMTPAENARAVGRLWEEYIDAPVTPAKAAAELGVTEEMLVAKVKAYAAANTLFDPLIAGFAKSPAIPMRREHLAEVFPQLVKIVGTQP